MNYQHVAPRPPRRRIPIGLVVAGLWSGGSGLSVALIPAEREAVGDIWTVATSYPILTAALVLILAVLICITIVVVTLIKSGDLVPLIQQLRRPPAVPPPTEPDP